MKILYVSQFYYPERAAGAFRAIDNSIIWSEYNHDVTIFTSYPNFPGGKIFKGYSNELISKEMYKGVKLIRNKIIPIENTSKLKRAIASISFVFYSFYNMIFNKNKIGRDYDVVLGTSGTILAPILAYVFSKINEIPFILELRDITYNQMLAVYDNKKTPLYYLSKMIELYLCKKASKVVVVTNGFKKILIEDGIDADKIEVIPNGAIIKEDYNQKYMIDKDIDTVTFSYIGNVGGSQNLKKVIDIFENIKIVNKKKRLIIIGDGGKKEELKRYIKENNVQNVELLDGMEYKELDKYYKKSHFCIVSLNNNNKFIETIPSKIFISMSKKRPILFLGPKGEASQIIKKSKSGLIYNSKDYMTIARDISLTINSYISQGILEKNIYKFGQNGYKFVKKNHNRQDLAIKYIGVINKVINNNCNKNNKKSNSERNCDEEKNMPICVERVHE